MIYEHFELGLEVDYFLLFLRYLLLVVNLRRVLVLFFVVPHLVGIQLDELALSVFEVSVYLLQLLNFIDHFHLIVVDLVSLDSIL